MAHSPDPIGGSLNSDFTTSAIVNGGPAFECVSKNSLCTLHRQCLIGRDAQVVGVIATTTTQCCFVSAPPRMSRLLCCTTTRPCTQFDTRSWIHGGKLSNVATTLESAHRDDFSVRLLTLDTSSLGTQLMDYFIHGECRIYRTNRFRRLYKCHHQSSRFVCASIVNNNCCAITNLRRTSQDRTTSTVFYTAHTRTIVHVQTTPARDFAPQ